MRVTDVNGTSLYEENLDCLMLFKRIKATVRIAIAVISRSVAQGYHSVRETCLPKPQDGAPETNNHISICNQL